MPLYSTRLGKVAEGSGLNQWNAGGRLRHKDEAYIPIPKWIHEVFPMFFPYSLEKYQIAKNNGRSYEGPSFTLELPDGQGISAKVCQENGKALMSNPNSLLGKWLLRHVLQAPPGQLVTYDFLERLGIDSVLITKINKDYFRIDFAKLGSFAKFKKECNN